MTTPGSPSQSRRVWALYLWAGVVVGTLLMHVIWPQPGQDEAYWAWPVGLMPFPIAGALILAQRPRNGVGRALHVVGIAAFLVFFTWWLSYAIYDSPLSPYVEVLGDAAALTSFLSIGMLLHVFPTGKPIGRRHRQVVRVAWILIGLCFLLTCLTLDPLSLSERSNPLAVQSEILSTLSGVVLLILSVLIVGGVGVLIQRRRRGEVVEQIQLRWFLSAAVLALLSFVFFSSLQEPVDELLGISPGSLGDHLVGVFLVVCMFWSIPIAITIAVLRYRLFEIDRLVSRTVTYVVVVAVLLGTLVGLIVGIQALLPTQNDLAVAASTLAVAALFSPIRKRVQTWVDRRFNRSRYDAQQEIEGFAGSLREAHDVDEITGDIIGVVSATMQPEAVGVWVRTG